MKILYKQPCPDGYTNAGGPDTDYIYWNKGEVIRLRLKPEVRSAIELFFTTPSPPRSATRVFNAVTTCYCFRSQGSDNNFKGLIYSFSEEKELSFLALEQKEELSAFSGINKAISLEKEKCFTGWLPVMDCFHFGSNARILLAFQKGINLAELFDIRIF